MQNQWTCEHCNVFGTWDEWLSDIEPGEHKCDICLEDGRSGILTRVSDIKPPQNSESAKDEAENQERQIP